jgi:hypothetical protein
MMSQRSKRELLEEIRPRYRIAKKQEKHKILDEFMVTTGFHRKYAIRVLNHGPRRRTGKKPGLAKKYTGEVVAVLERIWEICGCICSKRLHPFLPEMVKVLERCQELTIPAETKDLLLRMSPATMDRCLRPIRVRHPRGRSTTKPGTLLRKAIPIRTYTPWDEEKPGFMEVDLVAHCGETTEGQYLNTLTGVDIATTWVECMPVLRRTQEAVCEAVHAMRDRLPFPLLGLDSDNGGEFINDLLFRYCRQEQITFTRSRAYRKNDQAHVEQKNWSVVRRLVGYDRFETDEEYRLLYSLYETLHLYANFFQPVVKLVAKESMDKKHRKRYDRAATPFQRVWASEAIPFDIKARLMKVYVYLNPVSLRESIDAIIAQLWRISR